MNEPFNEYSVPDQSGKTIVITGANSGIGYEAARVLAGKGAKVIMACRSRVKGEEAINGIKAIHPNAKLQFLALDLGDLASVRTAASRIIKRRQDKYSDK